MKKLIRKTVILMAGTTLLYSTNAIAEFPNKPITIVVPYAPGGNTDQIGRMVAASMSEKLGQSVVVQNKPGANATVGNASVANSAPDGYTLLVGNTSMVLNPLLYKSLPYDQNKLKPIAMVVQFPLVLVTNNDIPSNNVKEFVSYIHKNKGKINFSSAGFGNSTHLAGELFKTTTGTDIVHVPYNGSSLALTSVISGDSHAFFDTSVTALPHINSGKLKPLAIASSERIPALPNVPTIVESGYPEYGSVTAWQSIYAPVGTPPEVVTKLREAINTSITNKKNKTWVEQQGGVFFSVDETGEIAETFIQSEQKKWADLISSLNIKLEQ